MDPRKSIESTAVVIVMFAVVLVSSCNIASTGSRGPKKPIPGLADELFSDVWLGAIEFPDFLCGLSKSSSPTGTGSSSGKPSSGGSGDVKPTDQPAANPLRDYGPAELNDYDRIRYINNLPQRMAELPTGKVNPYKFDHSFVYFRGHTFEWGASVLYDYTRGNIGRDPHACPAMWSLQRGSNCTLAEAEVMAERFGRERGAYDLLSNNCHHFAEWFMTKLLAGECSSV